MLALHYLLFGYLLATSDLISCVLPENHKPLQLPCFHLQNILCMNLLVLIVCSIDEACFSLEDLVLHKMQVLAAG